jgi:hypothetical protein
MHFIIKKSESKFDIIIFGKKTKENLHPNNTSFKGYEAITIDIKIKIRSPWRTGFFLYQYFLIRKSRFTWSA